MDYRNEQLAETDKPVILIEECYEKYCINQITGTS